MHALATQRRVALVLFLLPGLGYLCLVRILPALSTVFLSFTNWNMKSAAPPRFAGLGNYTALWADSGFLVSIGRTLVFMVVVTALELALGLVIALLVNHDFFGRRLLRTLLLMPMVIAPAVVGMMWYILFHDTIGPLNWLLSLAGLGPVNWLSSPGTAMLSVMIADVWHWTPFTFLLLLAALQTIPGDLYESAEMDGASRWQAFRFVTLPMMRTAILVAALLRSMEAFEIFAEPFVMTGGGPGTATDLLSLHIYKSAFLMFDMGYAAAMIVVSIAILLTLYAGYLGLARLD